jgi:dipeptidyl aminopeptidase/acylaminoacyl peptidase
MGQFVSTFLRMTACLFAAFTTTSMQAQTPVTATAATSAVPAKLPVEAFATIPFVELPTLSADGKWLAGVTAQSGAQAIIMMPLFGKTDKATLVGVPDRTEIDAIRWVNADNIVVGMRVMQEAEGQEFYLSRLVGINRLTNKITRIKWDSGGQNGGNLLWTAKDGTPDIVFAAQDSIYSNEPGFWPSVYRANIETGKIKSVLDSRQGVIDWSADGTGNVRMGYGIADEGRISRIVYRAEGKTGLFKTIDRANSRRGERVASPFLFLPGSNHGLVMEDNEAGMTVINQHDLSAGSQIKTIFTAPKGEVAYGMTSDDGTTLLGVGTTDPDKPQHWIDPTLAALQTQFDAAVSHGRARIVSMNQDRQKMLVRIDAPDMAGSLYYYDTAVGKLNRIAFLNDQLKSRRMSPVKAVQYKARDGLQIEAILTLPAGKPATSLPLILMPHGGPWAHDTLDYDYWTQFLASRGYAVIQPNFRGSTGYGTPFLRKGDGQLGLAMQDDLNDAASWAVSNGIADAKRVCIVGGSYGGYASMWGIVRDPDAFRCAISIAGVANLRREVNEFGRYLQGGRYQDEWERMTPDFKAVSPLGQVDRIKVPLLLIHGKKDVTVDHRQSQVMYDKMKSAGKPVEFVSLPLADHYFTRQDDRVKLLSAMESFLARHNPAN